jgi:uncharacterized protein YjbI with pentapeptide repeats
MKPQRRKYILVGAALLSGVYLAACDKNKPELASKRRSAMIPKPTKDEMDFLRNVVVRRTRLKDGPLEITGKLFDNEVRLDGFEWENTHFVNCDFVGCTMLGGALRNVRFTNCLFVANLWDKGQWDDVSFSSCAWQGRFNMGPSLGARTLIFEDCQFVGSTAEEMGYGGPADYFGIIGGTKGDVFYNKCTFERTYINGGASLRIKSCRLHESTLLAGTGSTLLVEDVTATGLIEIGSNAGDYSSVTIRRSKFARNLSLEGAKIGVGLFEDVAADLNLSIVKARSINLLRVTFLAPEDPNPQYQYGLNSESAKIGSMSITDCAFQGKGAALYLRGKKIDLQLAKIDHKTQKPIDLESTDVETLVIHNTQVSHGHFEYMNLGSLMFESLKIVDADFSNSKIQKFVLRDVSMSGKLEFANTVIFHRVDERVIDTSIGTRPIIAK